MWFLRRYIQKMIFVRHRWWGWVQWCVDFVQDHKLCSKDIWHPSWQRVSHVLSYGVCTPHPSWFSFSKIDPMELKKGGGSLAKVKKYGAKGGLWIWKWLVYWNFLQLCDGYVWGTVLHWRWCIGGWRKFVDRENILVWWKWRSNNVLIWMTWCGVLCDWGSLRLGNLVVWA